MILKRLTLLIALLVGLTTAQDINLKKLYDGIEDMRQEYEDAHSGAERPSADYDNETEFLNRTIGKKITAQFCKSELPYGKTPVGYSYLSVSDVLMGSFTKPNVKQSMYVFYFCDISQGIAILDRNKVIAAYGASTHIFDQFSVTDVNQNGLNELMLILQSKAKGSWGYLRAIQLLEFAQGKPSSLGSLFIGGPSGNFADGGPSPDEPCKPEAPPELRKFFPSNIIYVLKGKIPQFFAEGYEINCDYRQAGVKARKVSSLTPVKLVPRESELTRVY
jgi:hypothetical protein